MNRNSIYPPALEDAYNFCNMLSTGYRVQIQPVQKLNLQGFIGEFYTNKGTPMRLNITVYPNKTDVKVYTMNKQCVYQKSYSTVTDSKALSKSTGLLNFIKKAYMTM